VPHLKDGRTATFEGDTPGRSRVKVAGDLGRRLPWEALDNTCNDRGVTTTGADRLLNRTKIPTTA
jgi:hypothetical protein